MRQQIILSFLVIAIGSFGAAIVYGVHEHDRNPLSHLHPQAQASQRPLAPATGPANPPITEITMTDDDVFKPDSVTIPAGATVRWKNISKKDTHTVTNDPHVASDAKDVSFPAGAKPFNSGKIKPGGTFEQKFTVPGTYRYVCKPHEEMDMKGKIVVTAGSAAPNRPAR